MCIWLCLWMCLHVYTCVNMYMYMYKHIYLYMTIALGMSMHTHVHACAYVDESIYLCKWTVLAPTQPPMRCQNHTLDCARPRPSTPASLPSQNGPLLLLIGSSANLLLYDSTAALLYCCKTLLRSYSITLVSSTLDSTP